MSVNFFRAACSASIRIQYATAREAVSAYRSRYGAVCAVKRFAYRVARRLLKLEIAGQVCGSMKAIYERNYGMLNRHTVNFGFRWLAASLVWAMTATNAVAQGCCGGGGHDHGAAGGDSHSGHDGYRYHLPNGGLPPLAVITPHGGEFLIAAPVSLEVVYLPLETRVYLYGKSRQPLSARELRGQMSVQFPRESGVRHFPLQYVAQPSGSKEQDYVVAAVDLSQLPDSNIPIQFRFENLPDRQPSKAEFNPIFARSKIRSYVAEVSLTQADRDGIAGQRICPITGASLGSMGAPRKVLVGDKALYLCCTDCVDKVTEEPEKCMAQLP